MQSIDFGQGEELRKAIGAAVYIECSSKTQLVSQCLKHVLCETSILMN